MIINDRKPKYLVIADQLRNDIQQGRIRVGDSLPTQNQLIANHRVALGTARRVIDQLVSEGWARTEKRRGIFAQRPIEPSGNGTGAVATETYGFAVFGQIPQYDPVEQVVLRGFASVLKAAGKKVTYGVFPFDEKFEEGFNAFLDGTSGVVVNEFFDAKVLNILKRRHIRSVLVGYSSTYDPLFEDFHCVAPNIFQVGCSVGQLIGQHKHKKAVLVYPSESVYFSRIRDGVVQAFSDYGVELCGVYVARPGRDEEDVARKLVGMPEVTGVVVGGDMNACRLIQYLERLGVKVPDDKSVVAVGGISREGLSYPTLSRINVNLPMLGEEAAKQLLETTDIIIHKKVPSFYDKGSTLCFPKTL